MLSGVTHNARTREKACKGNAFFLIDQIFLHFSFFLYFFRAKD